MTIEKELEQLEGERETLAAEFRRFHELGRISQKYDGDSFDKLSARQTELNAKISRAKDEVNLKDRVRRDYLRKTPIRPEEFDGLWESRLRAETISEEAKTVTPRRHSYTRAF